MKTSSRYLLATFGLTLATGAAFGQVSEKISCMSSGGAMPEPLGTEGRSLAVASATCIVDGGPMSGGVATHNALWEADKGTMSLLSAHGVVRKPGSMGAFKLTSGTINILMQDGKPAGWTGSGKGVYTMGVGEAAALKDKPFSWTGKATGPRTHVIESKFD
jgi:hypothetical protein